MTAPPRVLLVLLVLALAGCTSPEDENQDSAPADPTTATGQPTTRTTPTTGTPTPATTGVTPTPATSDGNGSRRMLTGVEGEARYNESWDAETVVPKLQEAGFTVLDSSERGARLQHGGNNTTIEIEATTEGTTLRMLFESQPAFFEGDGEGMEEEVDRLVGAATPRFEETATAFEQATGYTRGDTLWVPLISAA